MSAFAAKAWQTIIRQVQVVVMKGGAIATVGLSAQGALADSAVSLLTLDGQVQSITGISQPPLRRMGLAEAGRGILIDEYALISSGPKGPVISFASEDFATGQDDLKILASHLESARTQRAVSDAAETAALNSPSRAERISQTSGLLIQHQPGHPPNHNFTPTPTADFVPQPISADELEGQRGFAIVTIGESGQVLRVKTVASKGQLRIPKLQTVIANGIKTEFQDERRHDHTVYLAYEVQGQTVRQRGQSLVTLPMCCPCGPPCGPLP